MKRIIFFILLVAGLSLKAQQSSTIIVPSLTEPSNAPVVAPLQMSPQLRQFAFQTQDGTTRTTAPAADADLKPPPDFRLEQTERKTMLTQHSSCSGLILDLSRFGQMRDAFDLRKPLDPNREFKNILLHIQNERPLGAVLFSLNF